MKKWFTIVATLFAVITLAACGGKANTSSKADSSSAESTSSSSKASEKKAESKEKAKTGVSEEQYKKIKVAVSDDGRGGATLAEVTDLLGKPNTSKKVKNQKNRVEQSWGNLLGGTKTGKLIMVTFKNSKVISKVYYVVNELQNLDKSKTKSIRRGDTLESVKKVLGDHGNEMIVDDGVVGMTVTTLENKVNGRKVSWTFINDRLTGLPTIK